MPISLEKLPDTPIAVFVILPNSDVGREMEGNIDAIKALLDAQPVPIYLIYDLRDMTLGLDDIVKASNMATQGANAILHHSQLIESVFVVTDNLIKLALSGLTTATFGSVRLSRFTTTEDALAYCQQKISVSG